MKNSTDVVYVLGTGSSWNNNELRFSLRSVQKHLKGYRNIYVVGEKPEWLSKAVKHIPCPDIYENNADGNIIHKVLNACIREELSSTFLFINDDHILLKDINIEDIPPFHKGDLMDYPDKYFNVNIWRNRLGRTKDILREKGLSTYHFDCHTPILFDKQKFIEIMQEFNYQEGFGYTMKSLYGNSIGQGVRLQVEKKTVFFHMSLEQIKERLKEPTFLSFNDDGLNIDLKFFLDDLFPKKSLYEKDVLKDKHIDIRRWLSNPRSYERGRMLFELYGKGENIKSLFARGDTPSNRRKLEYKLNAMIS